MSNARWEQFGPDADLDFGLASERASASSPLLVGALVALIARFAAYVFSWGLMGVTFGPLVLWSGATWSVASDTFILVDLAAFGVGLAAAVAGAFAERRRRRASALANHWLGWIFLANSGWHSLWLLIGGGFIIVRGMDGGWDATIVWIALDVVALAANLGLISLSRSIIVRTRWAYRRQIPQDQYGRIFRVDRASNYIG
jgi:hypothetical protein